MDNKILKEEAERITIKLIKINNSDKSLDKIFHDLLNPNFVKYDMRILYLISSILAENNYFIKSFNPFILNNSSM